MSESLSWASQNNLLAYLLCIETM